MLKVVVGLCAVLPFTCRPLLTGPWLFNSITLTAFTAGEQTKMDRSFPSCTTEHVHQQRQNGCFRDGIHRSNRMWICCCSLMKSWLIMFFTQNLHSYDRTTGESVLLVLGLFFCVWDDRTSGQFEHWTFMKLAPDIHLMKCLLLISLVKMTAELPSSQASCCNCGGGQLQFPCFSWKINCIIGRSTVLFEDIAIAMLEDQLCYWKIDCIIGRSIQSTRIDGNYRSRKITEWRWLHKYVGAECGASSFTWYWYQISYTEVRIFLTF